MSIYNRFCLSRYHMHASKNIRMVRTRQPALTPHKTKESGFSPA